MIHQVVATILLVVAAVARLLLEWPLQGLGPFQGISSDSFARSDSFSLVCRAKKSVKKEFPSPHGRARPLTGMRGLGICR